MKLWRNHMLTWQTIARTWFIIYVNGRHDEKWKRTIKTELREALIQARRYRILYEETKPC